MSALQAYVDGTHLCGFCGHTIKDHSFFEDHDECDVPDCGCSEFVFKRGLREQAAAELAALQERVKRLEEALKRLDFNGYLDDLPDSVADQCRAALEHK